ncbi:MAG: response regulator transcription factor [Treponema sp.]|uniref:response regulator transcription factor n=1 Tax=Treponema sp. TaxID=166 RepID=UPI00257FF110|nr:response regulator transcription factor [Treponema sp.]MBQ5538234.1 response regulator transcription factor [Treponema sp.]
MRKILIVEDDGGISDFVEAELRHDGFETVVARTGREGIELFEKESPDMILLDVMLPEINGLEVLRKIRAKSSVPIILETARGETIDKINGLNSGADDYIAKPFEIEELLARMNAIFRRMAAPLKPAVIRIRDIEMNMNSMGVTVGGESLSLSKTEFFMLKNFMENPGKVMSRDEIIDAIWGKNHYIDMNTVDVYVGYLRSKIGSGYIVTVRGLGYKFQEE